MSDLIVREDAIKVLHEVKFWTLASAEATAIEAIKCCKSARPKGEWIVLGGTDFNGISYCAKCSNCKAVYDGIRLSNYSYCPNCGADMRPKGE